jgi:glyoxylase-like metal-dependent hydrolase (beta-lactamase superfamily II)
MPTAKKEPLLIIERLVVGPFASNCYIVGSEPSRQGLIVDPGDEAGQILARVKELALDIRFIVLTHGHIDHTGALKEVKEATGACIAVHADDAGALDALSLLLGIHRPSPPPPDTLLKDGDSINLDDLHFTVRHTPGHSPGGICLEGEGVVFSGDTLFNYGIGRTDLPGGSYTELMDSIQAKLMVLSDNTVVYPGHGPETTIGAERRGNPFLRGLDQSGKIS